jgi:hypothetical protein
MHKNKNSFIADLADFLLNLLGSKSPKIQNKLITLSAGPRTIYVEVRSRNCPKYAFFHILSGPELQ